MNRRLLFGFCLCFAIFYLLPSCDRQKCAYSHPGLRIEDHEGYSIVDVGNPWDPSKLLQTYILIPRDAEVPAKLPSGIILRTPLERIVVYSSVHASAIAELGALDHIAGVCEAQYVTSVDIADRITDGRIADIGEAGAPNIEKIIESGADAILASPFENIGHGTVDKLGIPIIEAADYMENTPLARAEWIRFYGMLVGKRDVADSLFGRTCERYEALSASAAVCKDRPTVITERKYGASWSIPGGRSYMSVLLKDAGADYVFGDNMNTGATSVSFETVLNKGRNADIWLIKYASEQSMSYNDLKNEYGPYSYFEAFRNHRIFTCNTVGTTYYDDILLHPDYILEDMIHIFHPEVLAGFESRYYAPMVER